MSKFIILDNLLPPASAIIVADGLVESYSTPKTHYKNLAGRVFGRLTALKALGTRGGYVYWECICICGNITNVPSASVLSGNTASCGCLGKENRLRKAKTHNMSTSSTYKVWINMLTRCRNPNNRGYNRYGGRGITVCERWFKFENFLEDMGEVPESLTLDRKNNDGNYCKENCRWASHTEQARNKSTSRSLTVRGVTKSLAEWSKETGIGIRTLHSRKFRQGYSDESCLDKPLACGVKLATKVYKTRKYPDMSNLKLGYESPNSKFTPELVKEIQALHTLGKHTFSSIARQYNCSVTTVSNICQRKKHYA